MSDMPLAKPGVRELVIDERDSNKIALIKGNLMPGASDDELFYFIAVCNRTGLDPYTRQIYAVPRWNPKLNRNVYVFQTGIDGLRLIAERTGQYAYQEDPYWLDKDNNRYDVWLKDEPPAAAVVRVHRRGIDKPFVGIAVYKEFCQTDKAGEPIAMWKKMPAHMLAKCAEAGAFRKAFPTETAGLMTTDEPTDGQAPKNMGGQINLSEQRLKPAVGRDVSDTAKPAPGVYQFKPLEKETLVLLQKMGYNTKEQRAAEVTRLTGKTYELTDWAKLYEHVKAASTPPAAAPKAEDNPLGNPPDGDPPAFDEKPQD